MEAKLAKIYYGPGGYWKGIAMIKKLAEATKVPEETAKKWLISKRSGRYTSPRRGEFLHRNSGGPRGCKVYKYALTVVDVASRYKEAEPLTSKTSDEVAQAFQKIYKHSPLKWPEMLQVDPGHEFMGVVTKEMEKHKTYPARAR